MTFTTDSRWLAVSTKRGTTHLFAINPYGGKFPGRFIGESMRSVLGAVNVRSHTKASVMNKVSRSNRTATYDEQTVRPSNHAGTENGPKDASASGVTNSSSNLLNGHSMNHPTSARTKRTNSECIFSTAVTLIRQPTENFVSGLSVQFNMDSMCLAATFGLSRGFINPEEMMNQQEQSPRACSSLFIISWHGRLIEYVLEPVAGKQSLLSLEWASHSIFRHK